MRSQHGVTAPIHKPKHVVVGDLLTETDAARAENAAFVIECDPRPEYNVFWFLDLVLEKTRFGIAEINADFLQATFASLIAYRAIERMIDKQEFHHTALTLLHQRRIGTNRHAFGYVLGTGDLRTRNPVDDRFAVGAELWFAIRAEPREAHFDQTHPTIARRAQLFVITITRHITSSLLARLYHAHAFRKLMPDTVNLDVEQRN